MMHIKIPRPSDLIITGGLFAPTIRYHESVFYIVCTNAVEDPATKEHSFRNFFISCTEAQINTPNSWSDPIYFDFPGIDPSLFFDSGHAYIQGSYREGPPGAPDCSIRQFEIDVESGKPLSETRLLWKGAHPGGHAEGPHVYHKDDWYYLVTAEGSTFEGHSINIARSRDIWGPYEGYAMNPLLTALNTAEEVQWTGHGDLFQDKDGRWWCVHLGVRQSKDGPSPLGRETFLTPVSWEAGSWPKITQTKLEFELPITEDVLDHDGREILAAPGVDDLFIRTPEMSKYRFDAQNGYRLQPQSSTMSAPYGSTTFVGRRQRSLNCSAVVELSLSSLSLGQICAGLAVYKDSLRHAEIFFNASKQQLEFGIASIAHVDVDRPQGTHMELQPSQTDVIALRIDADSERYTFSWSMRGIQIGSASWHQFATIKTTALSGHDMTGAIFGIFTNTSNDGVSESCNVSFANFRVSNNM
jgi:beta-xylosidase